MLCLPKLYKNANVFFRIPGSFHDRLIIVYRTILNKLCIIIDQTVFMNFLKAVESTKWILCNFTMVVYDLERNTIFLRSCAL